jgi:hypothetical protein
MLEHHKPRRVEPTPAALCRIAAPCARCRYRHENLLYVAEERNGRVEVFDEATGKHSRSFRLPFMFPSAVAIGRSPQGSFLFVASRGDDKALARRTEYLSGRAANRFVWHVPWMRRPPPGAQAVAARRG